MFNLLQIKELNCKSKYIEDINALTITNNCFIYCINIIIEQDV